MKIEAVQEEERPTTAKSCNAKTVLVPPGACSHPGFHKKLRSFALSPIDRPASSRERREELREKIERYQNIDRAKLLWECNDYAFVAEAKAKTIELRNRTLELFQKVDASETLAVKDLRREFSESQTDSALDHSALSGRQLRAGNEADHNSQLSITKTMQNDAQLQLPPMGPLQPIDAVGDEVGAEELARRKSKIRSIRSTMRQRIMDRAGDSPKEKLIQRRMFNRDRSGNSLSSSSSVSSGQANGPLMRLMSMDLGQPSEDSFHDDASEIEGDDFEEYDNYVASRNKKSLSSLAAGMNSIQELAEDGEVALSSRKPRFSAEPQSTPTSRRTSLHVSEQQRRASLAMGENRTSKISVNERLNRARHNRASVETAGRNKGGPLDKELNNAPRLNKELSNSLDNRILFENTRDIANIFSSVTPSHKRASLQAPRPTDRTGGHSLEHRDGRIRILSSQTGEATLELEVHFPSTTRRKAETFVRFFTTDDLAEVFTWGLMREKSESERFSWLCGLVFVKHGSDQTTVGLKYFDDSKNKGRKASCGSMGSTLTVTPTDCEIADGVRGLFHSTRERSSFLSAIESNPIASSRGLKSDVVDKLNNWYESMKGGFDLTNHSLIPFVRKVHRAIGRREVDHEHLMRLLRQGRDAISSGNSVFEQFLDWLVYLFPNLRHMQAEDVRRFADLVERQAYDPEKDLDSFTEAMSAL